MSHSLSTLTVPQSIKPSPTAQDNCLNEHNTFYLHHLNQVMIYQDSKDNKDKRREDLEDGIILINGALEEVLVLVVPMVAVVSGQVKRLDLLRSSRYLSSFSQLYFVFSKQKKYSYRIVSTDL